MPQNKLFIPGKTTFPLAEAIARVLEAIEAIQCKSGAATKFEPSTCLALRRDLGLGIEVPIHVWIVTTARRFDDWCKLIKNPWKSDRKRNRLNSSHLCASRMPSYA